MQKALEKDTPAAEVATAQTQVESIKRGYIARELVLCTLPHRDPGDVRAYSRKNGKFTLTILPGYDAQRECSIGFPYGIIPRLVLFWIISEVVGGSGRRIDLGNTMNEFLRDVGLDPNTGRGKRGDGVRVKEQIRRLMNAQISFSYVEGTDEVGSETKGFLNIPHHYQFFWDFQNPNQASFFDSYIELSQDFHDAILASPVPIDITALRKLKRSPLAIDVYVWVCYRAYILWDTKTASVTIPYKLLELQFGSEYKRTDNFKHALQEAMEKIAPAPGTKPKDKEDYAYPDLKYEFTSRGLTLRRSRPAIAPTLATELGKMGIKHIPKKGISDDARAKAKAMAPGWDINALANDWKAWVEKKGLEVRDPDAHFLRFIKTHVKQNGA